MRTTEHPYHITTRSNNRDWFYIPIADVWIYTQKYLSESTIKFEVQIEDFVLMNNHYHLLVRAPKSNIDQFMQYFNRNLSRSISRQAGRINRIFGAPYKGSVIHSEAYYRNIVRYIYQNPLRSGLVRKIEDYSFSDLKPRYQAGLIFAEELTWMNQLVGAVETEKMR